jgi:hypothetical protein
VVATILKPNSHQGISRPERKKSAALFPDFLAANNPIAKDNAKKAIMMAQSIVSSCMTIILSENYLLNITLSKNLMKPSNKKKV